VSLALIGVSLASTASANELVSHDASSEGKAQRVTGLVVAGAGLAAFAGAVYLGRERAKTDEAHCTVDVCSSMASLLIQDARAQSNTAFRMMGVGALAMIGGITLYLTSSGTKPKHSLNEMGLGLGAGGITFKTTF
jgi:hypothetical protein